MAKVLFADYDFPDIELERSLFAGAGVELATAQCRTEDAVIAAARDCAAILCQYAPVTERVAAALPGVGLVSRIGAGFDNIDTDACARHGLWVANSPDYGVGEVATHALALSLAMMRNIVAYHRDIGAGKWHYESSGKLRRATNMTLGIVGLGRIGKRMAHISRNVFKRVIACDPYIIDGDFPAYVERGDLSQVFAESDVVSLHVPLNQETRGMINGPVLAAMRPGSFLVNTARGAVVDVDAALAALERGNARRARTRRPAGGAGARGFEAPRPSARDPDAARRVLLGRGRARAAPQGRAEHRHVPAHGAAGLRGRRRNPHT